MRPALAILILAACHQTHEPVSLGELFAGTTAPALAGPVLRGVDWKISIKGAEAALGIHATSTLGYAAIGTQTSQLDEIVITSRSTSDSEATLTNLWGTPVLTTKTGDAANPAGAKVWYGDHVMARYFEPGVRGQDRALALVHVTPLAEELGTSDRLLGFERSKPLIGSTFDEIKATYGDVLQDPHGGLPTVLQFPSDELDSFLVTLRFDDHRIVEAVHFYVHMQSPLSDARQALIAKRFGPLTTAENGSRHGTFAGSAVEVLTSSNPDDLWSVTLSKT